MPTAVAGEGVGLPLLTVVDVDVVPLNAPDVLARIHAKAGVGIDARLAVVDLRGKRRVLLFD